MRRGFFFPASKTKIINPFFFCWCGVFSSFQLPRSFLGFPQHMFTRAHSQSNAQFAHERKPLSKKGGEIWLGHYYLGAVVFQAFIFVLGVEDFCLLPQPQAKAPIIFFAREKYLTRPQDLNFVCAVAICAWGW